MPPSHAFEQQIVSAMRRAAVPGVAIALVEADEPIYSRVFGVRNDQARTPLATDTPFQAASLSKPVFAYAALKLCEQGPLDLDMPLATFGPVPACDDSRISQITARHVLSHTTGFPNWREDEQLTIAWQPGTHFGYSGEGYEYLQRVIERLTGQPLHAYIRASLLEPLGMRHSSFAWGVDQAGDFLLDEDGNVQPPGELVISSAAFSLLTTAPDYGRFLQAMLAPAEDDPVRLSAASVAAMLSPQILVGERPALWWGLGWGIQRRSAGDLFWHWGGAQNGYTNYTATLPAQRLGVAIFTNSEDGLSICEEIARLALGETATHPAFEWLLPLEDWRPDGM